MQRYLLDKILNLDSCVPKSFHEFFERLIMCLSQAGQGDRGNTMKSVGCVLRTKAFNEGVEVVYGPRWESTIPGQCHLLEGRWEKTIENHIIISVKVCLSQESIQMLIWIYGPIILL